MFGVHFDMRSRMPNAVAVQDAVVPRSALPAIMDQIEGIRRQGREHDIDRLMQDHKYASPGDRVVIVAGSSLGSRGMMNESVASTATSPSTLATAMASRAAAPRASRR